MIDDLLVRAGSLGRVFGSGRAAVSAVADVSFIVGPSARIALVGPSGSGKSTLLHLIAGIDEPTGGTIDWPALGPRERLRPGPIGIAFQGPSLLPPLTILENVALPIILAGGSERDAEADAAELLEAFDVGELASKLPEEVSGGQSQRVGLARAFAGSPRLVLADEPTGQQDHATGARVMEAALALASRDRTSLVVATHDRSVAALLSVTWSIEDGHLRTEVMTWSA
jgi:ABC-type lipoprotein export system ATPase subunit